MTFILSKLAAAFRFARVDNVTMANLCLVAACREAGEPPGRAIVIRMRQLARRKCLHPELIRWRPEPAEASP